MDKIEGMRAFAEVVKHSGFAAAGRHMGLSRAVVNKLVLQLEAGLGVKLLQRTTRRVSPTDEGRVYYERCLNILAELEAAELEIAHLHTEPKGTLRLNAPMSFGIMHLAPAIAQFMVQYPQIQVQLTLNDRFVDPLEEGFDLTLRIAELKGDETLTTQAIAPIRRVLCAAPSYLNAHGIPQSPEDLRHHDCLQYGYLTTRSQWRLIGPDQQPQSVTIHGRYCANNGEALREAAIKGIGIALLPIFIVDQALRSNNLEIVLPDYPPSLLTAYLGYPPNRHLATKIQVLTTFLQNWFQHPTWDSTPS